MGELGTEILTVGLGSVVAAVGAADDRGQHLTLTAGEADGRVHDALVEDHRRFQDGGVQTHRAQDAEHTANAADGGVVDLLQAAGGVRDGYGSDPGHQGHMVRSGTVNGAPYARSRPRERWRAGVSCRAVPRTCVHARGRPDG